MVPPRPTKFLGREKKRQKGGKKGEIGPNKIMAASHRLHNSLNYCAQSGRTRRTRAVVIRGDILKPSEEKHGENMDRDTIFIKCYFKKCFSLNAGTKDTNK